MSFPEILLMNIPNDGAGNAVLGQGIPADARQFYQRIGYDFKRDGGTWTGNVEASVAGNVWTVITALTVSAQGGIVDHYNYVRVNVTGAGLLGNDELRIAGKVLR